MKWIFGFLILANVGLLMWGMWYREPLAPFVVPQPRPTVAEEKLKLLSEPGVRLTARVKPPSTPSGSETASASAMCYRLGPFTSVEKTRYAGMKLEGWSINKYERLAEYETHGMGYRVYLPPLPSKQAAEAKRRQLARLGFSDHAVVQDEKGMENAISLGFFTVEQNARARMQALARKGIRASMQTVPNVRTVYWLTFRAAGAQAAGFTPKEDEYWGAPEATLQKSHCDGKPAAAETAS